MVKTKYYKGEKYIYLLMGYKLALLSDNNVRVGKDTGITGGQDFERTFKISNYQGKTLLIETKYSRNFADFSRTFEILNKDDDKPTILDYINEDGENAGQNWIH